MEYKVVYSKRKTISLCIKDGGLVVKAPFGTKRARIEGIVSSHMDWVDKNIKKQTERNEKYAGLTDENIAELKKNAKAAGWQIGYQGNTVCAECQKKRETGRK